MKRIVWTIGGLSTAAAAWLLFNQGVVRRRTPVPVTEAAEKLQQAWADHHTQV